MIRYTTQRVVMLAALFVLASATLLPMQPALGEGGARRDVVRNEEQNRQDAIKLAKEAVDHGKQGHVGGLLTSAESSLQHAQKSGTASHIEEGIAELKNAIKHAEGGHADVATKHAERAVTYLSEMK
ncbi:MAG: small metal-binding protein SmbP [Nitrospira sp.]